MLRDNVSWLIILVNCGYALNLPHSPMVEKKNFTELAAESLIILASLFFLVYITFVATVRNVFSVVV